MNLPLLAVASILTLALLGCSQMTTSHVTPQDVSITVHADQPGPKINPAMWGAFFEDINFGADGGLYAEMVKNRAFEFPDPLMGWHKLSTNLSKGDISVLDSNPYRPSNPHYLHVASKGPAPLGAWNEGFRGMGVKANDAYDFSAQIRILDGSPKVTVEIIAGDGTTLASVPLTGISASWSPIKTILRPRETDATARLNLVVEGPGTVDFDWVSLFPQKTWMNRPGGLRADMVQMLADLKPGFLRFPGGCIVEGAELSLRYQWKNTIGPVEDRKLLINRWNTEFKHRPTPDYYQSFGLGFFEFFQLCEDIGAKPLPIVNCGMACQFNSAELCTPEDLQNYIQDALDLIEFANGPATSTWGAKRAAMGHPAPFNMTMMGVGNEQWGPQYLERLAAFTKAIKAKYPDIKLVSDAGPSPDDDRFHYLWPKLQEFKADGHPADIVDQHCYANPIWFLANSNRYDKYDRNGPKVFFGEYAAQSIAICSPRNTNNLECALAEAAYMTGLERNADVVRMASYAPLFSNIDAWQWTPDLMWTNSLTTLATPNYYVQQLYCKNRGDVVLPADNTSETLVSFPTGRIGVGTTKASGEFKDVKVVHAGKEVLAADFASTASGFTGGDSWKVAAGAYRQSDPKASASSFAGSTAWTDYTLTLKARKLDGTDGLVITVFDDGKGAYAQLILGGWGNTQHGVLTHYAEQDQLLMQTPGTLENNRWYDIKITVHGAHMECVVDGKTMGSFDDVLKHTVPCLFTSASREDPSGDTLLKVVNPGNRPTHATIHLRGIGNIQPLGTATILAGNPADENTFANPHVITPKTETVIGVSPEFHYTFPPYSATVLRLKTAK